MNVNLRRFYIYFVYLSSIEVANNDNILRNFIAFWWLHDIVQFLFCSSCSSNNYVHHTLHFIGRICHTIRCFYWTLIEVQRESTRGFCCQLALHCEIIRSSIFRYGPTAASHSFIFHLHACENSSQCILALLYPAVDAWTRLDRDLFELWLIYCEISLKLDRIVWQLASVPNWRFGQYSLQLLLVQNLIISTCRK